MSSFKKTNTGSFAKASAYVSEHTQYWKNYEFPVTVKEFSTIDYIDVCPVEPHYIAVTTGPKINIYHQQTAQVWKTITLFQKGAYGGKFDSSGEVLLSGSEESHIRLFNYVSRRPLLREFKGHKGPVHRVDFVYGKKQVVGFSDDYTVSLWDTPSGERVQTFEEHKDFIRAGVTSPTSEDTVISGSYDHTVKVWDARSRSSVMTFQQGSPVETLLCYPSGTLIASAGGTEIKIFDIIGGKLLSVISQHHKNITCLNFASKNSRLLSGSLDRHVKVYDLTTFKLLHSMDYPAPVMSLGIAPGDSTLVTGLLSGNSGLISFQHRSTKQIKEISPYGLSESTKKFKFKSLKLMPGDELVTHIEKPKLASYDRQLAQFKFTKTLSTVLQYGIATKTPHVTVAVMRELIRRGGLATALAGRDTKGLIPLFRFLMKNFRNPLFQPILLEVINVLLDIYGNSFGDSKLFGLLSRLNEEVEMELEVSKIAIHLEGVIELYLNMPSRSESSHNKTTQLTSNLDKSLLSESNKKDEDKNADKEIVNDNIDKEIVDIF
ncbi:UNVERIFIED_CONTAM: hypothetical protein RMT77_013436 [Armadillidium vulgare]